MNLHFMTTVSSGKSKTHGADDGVTGWKLHLVDLAGAVNATARTKYGPVVTPHVRAFCGLYPKLGWGIDLFIEDKCERCIKKAEKLGIDWTTIE